MAKPVTISLDGMGGDHAPAIVIDGAARALKANPSVRFVVYGDEAAIRPHLDRHPALAAATTLRHTPDRVTSDDKPAIALRQRRQSSMRLAIDAVANGEADAVVSAGNTGALMAMAKFSLKVMPGIDRPAICTYMPTKIPGHGAVFMDLGANAECDPQNLVEFAVLGGVFSRELFKIDQPKIGLLNIGSEAMKGTDLVKDASELLEKAKLPGRYVGYAEGDEIMTGHFDVIITDGFTGNVALKTIEGTAKVLGSMVKQAFKGSLLMKLGMLMALPGLIVALPGLLALRKRADPRYYNGASLLGLKGLCIKSHGGTDEIGFANAIAVAADLAANQFNRKVEAELEKLGHGRPVIEGAA
jgi:glycerol-3-phosphate acyltransferase PlsX